MLQKFANFLNDRPLSVMGIILSIRAAFFGYSFMAAGGGVTRTILYQNVDKIFDPYYYGLAFLIIGIFTSYAFLYKSNKMVDWGCTSESIMWIFAFFIYLFAGQTLLGLTSALPFAILQGYVGYAFRKRKRWTFGTSLA